MKRSIQFTIFLMFNIALLYSQPVVESFKPEETLSPDKCYDLIKTVWNGLKKISEDYKSHAAVKSEFESTAEFNERVRKSRDQFVNNVNKFFLENKLDVNIYSTWFKAELVKYDADNQVYNVKSSTQILVQPKKDDIAVVVPPNKYVSIVEKNQGGYRRAHFQLATEPEFSWFVNKQTAQAAKNKEHQIYFKLWFKFNVYVLEATEQIVIQLVPSKLALMDQQENFTYWSEDIRIN